MFVGDGDWGQGWWWDSTGNVTYVLPPWLLCRRRILFGGHIHKVVAIDRRDNVGSDRYRCWGLWQPALNSRVFRHVSYQNLALRIFRYSLGYVFKAAGITLVKLCEGITFENVTFKTDLQDTPRISGFGDFDNDFRKHNPRTTDNAFSGFAAVSLSVWPRASEDSPRTSSGWGND
jgi:hypothetical protein